ncbi:adenylyl-sulfate kinase [Robbsia andropogonis]|uniref:adenylyl-sulfate kinase n=1 Tax=Robbsia andropogonis TaxID=28092 RepID=UPI0004656364|nr:adenylyl-sulfate kinase [Robbsia andropogonis]MCP1119738.1 adenylyl-sulfate kinase [Robbsia andropogonis]MCP1129721.1 adenylyl-sulfate kinase [Robbsia andropogonis]
MDGMQDVRTHSEEASGISGRMLSARRARWMGQRPVTVWFTGLSGAGKSTLALALQQHLMTLGHPCCLLEDENVARGLCKDVAGILDDLTRPGDGMDAVAEAVRRCAEAARLINDNGMVVLAAVTAPLRAQRAVARTIIGASRFIEVHVSTPLSICTARDPRGRYAQVQAGTSRGLPGVDTPFQEPLSPAHVMDTSARGTAQCIQILYEGLAPRLTRKAAHIR